MHLRSKVSMVLLCCVTPAAAGCASNAPAVAPTAASAATSPSSGQPTSPPAPTQPAATAAGAPTQIPPAITETPASSPTATEAAATATTSSNTTNPLDLLSQLLNNFSAVESLRVQITQTGGTPTPMSAGMTMDVVKPDRMHSVIPGLGEVIQIGTTYYLRQGANGTWTKMALPAGAAPPAPPGTLFDPKAFVTAIVNTKGISFSGPDVLDGKPMLTFTYTPDPSENSDVVSGKLWVGATDGLPYKGQATQKDGSVLTVVFSYNTGVQINPPIP
jgi:hypothetical protein